MMFINSLETMEQIVENSNALSWDGWTVIETKQSPTAWMSKDGAFVNGKWVIRKRYNWSDKGWQIPNQVMSSNGQPE